MLQQCYMELLKQKEGGNRMNHYEAINDVLVNLFNEILDLEERALITGCLLYTSPSPRAA